MTLIAAYLEHGVLPNSHNESRKLMRKAAQYLIIDGVMYRRGFSMPLLRFGLPQKIVSDNGTQFDSQLFTDFCTEHSITKSFSAVLHPQADRQVESVNKILKYILKKCLELAKRNWPERLPKVLWSYRTTERTTIGDTPFALTYGYDAMLPIEMTSPSHRHIVYNQVRNHQLMANSLDQIEERREKSNICLASH
ncbi:uncharacterized protein LOC133830107 [Humulus lupulus]|uniref:uncharacterized protein LOC133830107 n=1 Tax=Humulus lupulus TaxID=3486 RepID=UPI002B4096D8|nr:uncharacterized protein LOC133830107 [Humulus lupulus]